jgi:hypothetical protein
VCGHHGQRMWHDTELYCTAVARRSERVVSPANYEPQHSNQEEVVRKSGLTGEVVGVDAIDGVEGGNCG